MGKVGGKFLSYIEIIEADVDDDDEENLVSHEFIHNPIFSLTFSVKAVWIAKVIHSIHFIICKFVNIFLKNCIYISNLPIGL